MKISRHCYAITGLGFIPPWSVNAGLIAGEVATLVVDTGATMQAARTIYGYASSVRPNNRLLVINTERHLDHVSGNSLFREQGCDIYGHPGIARDEAELDLAIAELNACISGQARRQQQEARVFYAGTHIVNPNREVNGETQIALGSFSVQVFPTPGHTSTNLSIFAPIDSVLYCGDCLVSAYLPNLEEGTPEDWRDWLRSLERIEALSPEIVVPGHGEVLRGPEVRAEIQRTRAHLRQAIASGHAPTFFPAS